MKSQSESLLCFYRQIVALECSECRCRVFKNQSLFHSYLTKGEYGEVEINCAVSEIGAINVIQDAPFQPV